ncbi:MAG: hypothetical protein ACREB9_00865 [Thermoplasmata archaeon]
MKDPEKVKAGRRARRIGRENELHEQEWWREFGFAVQDKPKKARYLGPGRMVLTPTDFFGEEGQAGWDLLAVHVGRPIVMAGVQVTESPFASQHGLDGTANRNAKHGPPPFDWPAPADDLTVLGWALCVAKGVLPLTQPCFVQVLASYALRENVDRRWWFR